jgi:hypothetical protein
MVTSLISKPSALIGKIQLEQVEQHILFKFNDELQERLEQLLEKKKADALTITEISELEAMGELERIFTHINAMLVAKK